MFLRNVGAVQFMFNTELKLIRNFFRFLTMARYTVLNCAFGIIKLQNQNVSKSEFCSDLV
jgi:hypothetical protein